jgi:hypothetical protein
MKGRRLTRKRGSEAGGPEPDALDREREASMADEGGVSAARVEAPPALSPAREDVPRSYRRLLAPLALAAGALGLLIGLLLGHRRRE